MNKNTPIIFIATVLIFVACSGEYQKQTLDTGATLAGSERKIDKNVYHITMRLDEEVEDRDQSTAHSSYYYYDGYARGLYWTQNAGKGLFRGTLLNMDPKASWAPIGRPIVVKTTDLKITALQPGDIVDMVCLADWEPVCAKDLDSRSAGDCADTWELDFCRLQWFNKETSKAALSDK